MLNEKQEVDLFDEASNPPEKTYDLFGKVEVNVWECAFKKGTRGGVPYDPARHEKRHLMVDMFIQPLAEIDVKHPKSLEFHDVTWSRPYGIVWNSLKALGINNLREISGQWARVGKVPDGGSYQRKDAGGNLMTKPDGSPDMVETTCFKFVQLFASEDECRAAYLAAGGAPANGNGHNTPAPTTNEDTERATAFQFLKVIVANAAKGKATFAEAQEAVGLALGQYPTVSRFYLANSVETGELITQVTGHLPF